VLGLLLLLLLGLWAGAAGGGGGGGGRGRDGGRVLLLLLLLLGGLGLGQLRGRGRLLLGAAGSVGLVRRRPAHCPRVVVCDFAFMIIRASEGNHFFEPAAFFLPWIPPSSPPCL
jgi:hypothetical protein